MDQATKLINVCRVNGLRPSAVIGDAKQMHPWQQVLQRGR
jgi:hypothetical protein